MPIDVSASANCVFERAAAIIRGRDRRWYGLYVDDELFDHEVGSVPSTRRSTPSSAA